MPDPISTIVGGITEKNKAGQAKRAIAEGARIQKMGVDQSLAKQGEMYNKNINLYQPQLKSGQQLQNTYSYLMGLGNADQNKYADVNPNVGDFGYFNKSFTLADFEKDPAYEFVRSEGQKALDRKAAASGRYFSGAAAKDLAKYNADYAGTKYNEARTRYNQDREALYSKYLTGLDFGNEAIKNTANLNTGFANTYGQLMTNRADIGANAVAATSEQKGRGLDANAAIGMGVYDAAKAAAGVPPTPSSYGFGSYSSGAASPNNPYNNSSLPWRQ